MSKRIPASDPIGLTRSLLQFDTINPARPGEGLRALRRGDARRSGASRSTITSTPTAAPAWSRALGGSEKKAPLCLTGHLDIVPLGARPWTKDPFRGETDGDKLYGRGSSDMKAGVAAILLAARSLCQRSSMARRAS